MKCTEIEKQIDSFISNEPDFAEKQKINLHLQECTDCRKEIKEIQESRSLLKTLPSIPVSNQFDARMMQAFRERQQEKAKPTFWQALLVGFSISKPALALGLLAIAVFTGSAFQLGRMTAPNQVNSEISVSSQSEQKGKPAVQIVEKRVEVPVIKTVEVPVYRERIVNRIVYKTREEIKPIKTFDIANDKTHELPFNLQNTAINTKQNNEGLITTINLKNFQPVSEMKARISRKGDENED